MKKLTTNEFILKAKLVHGDRYDYASTNYCGSKIHILIGCKLHGDFNQTPTRHLCGDGCPRCNGGVSKTQEEFIESSKNKHNDIYDYSLVKYVNSKTKVDVICKKHGIFNIKPNNHILGQGCYLCGIENNTYTTQQFTEKAQKIHGNIYDYSLVAYKYNSVKIKIICQEHGIFEQTPHAHLSGRGCSKCKIKSKGELFIANWLNQNVINFEVQKSFIGCKNVLPLRYDFYLPKHNMLIEYDGEPHFREVAYLGGKIGYELRQINDKLKTIYAANNDIKLLRIPYTERKFLSSILENNIITT